MRWSYGDGLVGTTRVQPFTDATDALGQGDTALHLAAQSGHTAVVEKLISAKAAVDAGNKYGRSLGQVRRLNSGIYCLCPPKHEAS